MCCRCGRVSYVDYDSDTSSVISSYDTSTSDKLCEDTMEMEDNQSMDESDRDSVEYQETKNTSKKSNRHNTNQSKKVIIAFQQYIIILISYSYDIYIMCVYREGKSRLMIYLISASRYIISAMQK